MEHPQQRQLAAIVFTDIVGYTQMMDRDEREAMERLKAMRELIYPLVEQHSGKVLKELGDGMLMMFGSANEAVLCARAIQQAEKSFQLRIGIHVGDVVMQDNDVFGSGVNIASRIQPLASPGGICISSHVWHQVRNNPDLRATSLGLQSLKGVSERVEVLALQDPSATAPGSSSPAAIAKELYRRRIPHVLAAYAVGGWLLLQALEWVVDQYVLSPHLTSFALFTLLFMTPTVFLIAYFHGRSGPRFTQAEKIGIPMNVLASVPLLFYTFEGKDLGAATTSVTINTEDGQTVERVIPKSEFRRKILIFFYDNTTGDSDNDWMQYAFPIGLHFDLFQDLFLTVDEAFSRAKQLEEAGYRTGLSLPLTLQRSIASRAHADYFVTGSIQKSEEGILVRSQLYDSHRGSLLRERSVTGADLFGLIDETALQLKRDIGIPEGHLSRVQDLPVAELLTSSSDAFREFTLAYRSWGLDKDFPGATTHLERAVQHDSTFAYAHYMLQVMYTFSNQGERREGAFRNAMQYLYKLPERMQFLVKSDYYAMKQDQEKRFAVLSTMVRLSPEDIVGREALASVHLLQGRRQDAIAEFEKILEIDPGQHDKLVVIGSLYQELGENERALEYFQSYAREFPQDHRALIPIGTLYKELGEYDKAREAFDQALVLKPEDVSLLAHAAEIEGRVGNVEKAQEQFDEALALAKTPQDRARILEQLADLMERQGQMGRAIDYSERRIAEVARFQPSAIVLLLTLETLDAYVKAGRTETAFRKIRALEQQLKPPFDQFIPFGYLKLYLESGQAREAEQSLQGVEAFVSAFKLEILRSTIHGAQARIAELNGDPGSALSLYQKQLAANPNDVTIQVGIGRCFADLSRFDEGEKALRKVLTVFPRHAEAHYELARMLSKAGNVEQAREHLKIASEVLRSADPTFPLKKKVDLLAGELRIAS